MTAVSAKSRGVLPGQWPPARPGPVGRAAGVQSANARCAAIRPAPARARAAAANAPPTAPPSQSSAMAVAARRARQWLQATTLARPAVLCAVCAGAAAPAGALGRPHRVHAPAGAGTPKPQNLRHRPPGKGPAHPPALPMPMALPPGSGPDLQCRQHPFSGGQGLHWKPHWKPARAGPASVSVLRYRHARPTPHASAAAACPGPRVPLKIHA